MTRRRRHTTAAEDAAFLRARLADHLRAWQAGDRTRAYRGDGVTTVVEFRPSPHGGRVAVCADGTEMHESHLRAPVGEQGDAR